MSDYPKTDSRIRHKVKIVLDLSNYPTKKNYYGVFAGLKVDINKLDLNKLVNFRTYLNNLNIE